MQTKHSNRTWLLSAAFVLFLVPVLSAQKDAANNYDKQPEYPGGMSALVEYMVKNLMYPEAAKQAQAEGLVLIKFFVNEDGTLSGIKTISEASRNPREDFVREAVRVVKSMPNWTPAEKGGKKVKAEMALPVQFKLAQDKP